VFFSLCFGPRSRGFPFRFFGGSAAKVNFLAPQWVLRDPFSFPLLFFHFRLGHPHDPLLKISVPLSPFMPAGSAYGEISLSSSVLVWSSARALSSGPWKMPLDSVLQQDPAISHPSAFKAFKGSKGLIVARQPSASQTSKMSIFLSLRC